MKKLVWIIGVTTFVVAVAYSVVSLGRWEWTRALYFGLIALLAEVGLATGLVLRKLDQRPRGASGVDQAVLARIRGNRPRSPNRFAWLDPRDNQMNVFITMLVGGGVLLSGLAWLVDRIASRTTTPAGEVRLARELGVITYPDGGLIVDGVTALAQDLPFCDDRQIRLLLRRSTQ